MSTRTRNLKSLFADVRTRTIILITFALLLISFFAGYLIIRENSKVPPSKVTLSTAPANIENQAGSVSPTPQYAALLEQENIKKAQEAEKTGKSSIPSIVEEGKFGEGTLAQLPNQASNLSPLQMALNNLTRNGCDPKSLADAIRAGATVGQLKEAGCSVPQLSAAGFTAQQLADAGFSACDMLSSSGIDPKKLKQAGFSAGELRGVGFNACQLKKAGFTAAELRAAGFTPDELKGVGFSPDEIAAAGPGPTEAEAGAEAATTPAGGPTNLYPGLPPGISPSQIKDNGCSVAALTKERAEGVSAAEIRKIAGCSAADLKAAGYSAKELKAAGFTAGDLKSAGFSAGELKDAGFNADDLKKAGFTAGQLRAGGYSSSDLKNAGYTPEQMLEGGYTTADLKNAGISDADLAKALDHLKATLPPAALKKLQKVDCSLDAVSQAHKEKVPASILRKMGCSAAELKAGGYTASELKDAGFTAGELKNAGFNADDLKKAGFTADQLRDAGFSPADLKNAGFTAEQLKNAGFTAGELSHAGFSANDLKNAGFSAAQLKNAGFTAEQLKNAGFTPSQLKTAGYTAAELHAAGLSAKDLKDLGYSANELKNAGFSAEQLKKAGFTPGQLKKAGFTASQLKNAGFSAKELKDAGYDAKALRDAGYSPKELAQSGFSKNDLLNAGYSNADVEKPQPETFAQKLAQESLPLSPQTVQATESRQLNAIQQQQSLAATQQLQSVIAAQAGQLLSAWKPSQQAYTEGVETPKVQVTGGSAQAGGGPNTGGSSSSNAPTLIKAGTILFAVLDTAINSDEPGPVLATIVDGPYKGAKLIGDLTTFGLQGEKVMVTFRSMNVPSYDNTIAINAVAIDADTARTGLSSYTNNHLLLRYGSLFASAFIEGYGQALLQSGQTVLQTGLFGALTLSRELSPGNKAMVALGNVGNKFGQQLNTLFNMPPTIHVYSGTGIGVLFVQDLKQPTS